MISVIHGNIRELRNQQKKTIEDIIIVDIDDRSLSKMGRYQQWEWKYHAEVIDYLTKSGIKAIGFDVLFIEPNKIQEQSDALAFATMNSERVYHALYFTPEDEEMFQKKMVEDLVEKNTPQFTFKLKEDIREQILGQDLLLGPFDDLGRVSKGLGYVSVYPDNDGVMRKIPLFTRILDNVYPAISVRIAMDVLGVKKEDIEIKPDEYVKLGNKITIPTHAQMWYGDESGCWSYIKYYGGKKTFRYISYYDVWKKSYYLIYFE